MKETLHCNHGHRRALGDCRLILSSSHIKLLLHSVIICSFRENAPMKRASFLLGGMKPPAPTSCAYGCISINFQSSVSK